MATGNFYTQADFPLFATSIFEIEDYIDDETGESCEGFFDEWHFDFCQKKIEEFNDSLQFFRLDLQSGYYSGIQTVLNPARSEIALSADYTAKEWREMRKEARDCPGSVYSWNFTLPYAEQVKTEKKEKQKILSFCRKYLKNEFGFDEYGISARFSSGETWYSKIA